MEYSAKCECGHSMTVTSGAAGSKLSCGCGRTVTVPSLSELRSQAGQSAYSVSPELVIEHAIRTGEYPIDNRCVECGQDTDQQIVIEVECERVIRKGGGTSFWAILGAVFIWWPLILFSNRSEEREFGRHKVYHLPVPACEPCRRSLRGTADLRVCLASIPVYDQLLEKFPNAKVRRSS